MPRKINLLITIAMLGTFMASVNAQTRETDSHYPGGVIQFSVEKRSEDLPEVKYGLAELAIIDRGKDWNVIMGIGLDTLPGEYVVYIKHGIKGQSGQFQKIQIRHHNYPFIEAKPKNAKLYNGLLLKHNSFSSIDFSNTQQPSLPLGLPLEGEWGDYFGYNIKIAPKQPLETPNAVSLITTELAPVRSPQSAIVSKIETMDNGLKRVFLDHGRGVYSIISGLSDLTIEVSNGIVAGAVIGKLPSGNNNANTANNSKRLIWQTVMNGEYVNPLLMTELTP
jgi:hypothetical protein